MLYIVLYILKKYIVLERRMSEESGETRFKEQKMRVIIKV